MVLFFIDCGN